MLLLSFTVACFLASARIKVAAATSVLLVNYDAEGERAWRDQTNQSRSMLCHSGITSGVACFRETVAANCQGRAALPINDAQNLDPTLWTVKEGRAAMHCRGFINTYSAVKAFSMSPIRGAHDFAAGIPNTFFATTLCDLPPLLAPTKPTKTVARWTAFVRVPPLCLGAVCAGGHCADAFGLLEVGSDAGACVAFTWTVTCASDTRVDFDGGDGWEATLQGMAWVQDHQRDQQPVRQRMEATSESAWA